ncbi:MAG: Mobile element protein [uncultured Paraburkholderia sp.]|nr:MAG: Mobile element protein [uncultured Paraburkholderia sp.]
MKTDGKLDRNWLKGALGDAMHAVLCGAGHNLRMILRKLKVFLRPHSCCLACPSRANHVRRMTPPPGKTHYSGATK